MTNTGKHTFLTLLSTTFHCSTSSPVVELSYCGATSLLSSSQSVNQSQVVGISESHHANRVNVCHSTSLPHINNNPWLIQINNWHEEKQWDSNENILMVNRNLRIWRRRRGDQCTGVAFQRFKSHLNLPEMRSPFLVSSVFVVISLCVQLISGECIAAGLFSCWFEFIGMGRTDGTEKQDKLHSVRRMFVCLSVTRQNLRRINGYSSYLIIIIIIIVRQFRTLQTHCQMTDCDNSQDLATD